jgi:hypothetical protein
MDTNSTPEWRDEVLGHKGPLSATLGKWLTESTSLQLPKHFTISLEPTPNPHCHPTP